MLRILERIKILLKSLKEAKKSQQTIFWGDVLEFFAQLSMENSKENFLNNYFIFKSNYFIYFFNNFVFLVTFLIIISIL
jgi:hypothetical protein